MEELNEDIAMSGINYMEAIRQMEEKNPQKDERQKRDAYERDKEKSSRQRSFR